MLEIENEINIWNRYASVLLDGVLLILLSLVSFFPISVINLILTFIDGEFVQNDPIKNPLLYIIALVIVLSGFLNKDFFGGRSIAKRALGMVVKDITTGENARPFKCFVRNITVIIFPVELIFMIFSPSQRLGDLIAGTKVEKFRYDWESKMKSQPGYTVPFLFTLVITLAVAVSAGVWINNLKRKHFLPESYNPVKSAELTKILNTKFEGLCDSVNLKYYEKTEGDSIKFLLLKFYLTEDELGDMKEKIIDTLNLALLPHNYILEGNVLYRENNRLTISFIHYDSREYIHRSNENARYEINDSAKVIRNYYSNGKLESETYYKDGLLTGTYREYYEDGKLKEEINYVDGKRNGIMTSWYSNGKKEAELYYENNTLSRVLHRWNEDGTEQ
jgi:uncharacterized RDD family membrane protein YckC